MKKTISITLAGRIFSIEEDGFGILEQYLNGLKHHFAHDESADELMADIEASIAEKFSEKLGSHKEVVTFEDVNTMIAVMGKLEEITEEDRQEESSTPHTASDEDASVNKHLYRNSDDVVIAGVCSGLGAYFGVSPTIMRIIFILLSFVNGLGILIYLILWAAVPLAVTNTQKFEMRGKRVNVDEIEQVVKGKMNPHSPLNKILNIPVVIIGAVVHALRAFFKVLGPVVSILVGILILLGAIAGIAGLSVVASMLFFPTNSASYISDLPITELTSQPLYYVGVASAYLFVLVPLTLLLMLATTLIRRKNSFRVVPVAGLIGLWILSASAGAVAARDIGPWAYNRVQEIERESTLTRSYSETDFASVVSTGNVEVRVVRGDSYKINATGLKYGLDQLNFTQKEGVLTISQNGGNRGPCIFCVARRTEIEITLPALSSYTAKGMSHVSLEGFREDFILNVEDAARIETALEGQNVTSTLKDVGRLLITGSSPHLAATLSDASRLEGEDLIIEVITLTQSNASRVYLQGVATEVRATLKDAARLNGEDLNVERTDIITKNASHAEMMPVEEEEQIDTEPATSTMETETAS